MTSYSRALANHACESATAHSRSVISTNKIQDDDCSAHVGSSVSMIVETGRRANGVSRLPLGVSIMMMMLAASACGAWDPKPKSALRLSEGLQSLGAKTGPPESFCSSRDFPTESALPALVSLVGT